MSAQSSEQALSALEHSKKPAVELLDDAANILGLPDLGLQTDIKVAASTSYNGNVAKFREQWILRWQIKSLARATTVDHQTLTPHALLENQKTWKLLSHVLKTIPQSVARDILVERNFCRTFLNCLKVLNIQRGDEWNRQTSVASFELPGEEGGRPVKKRKLSVEHVDTRRNPPNPQQELLLRLTSLASQVADILLPTVSDGGIHTQRTIANWIDNVEGAASLLGQILLISNNVVASTDKDSVSSALQVVEKWLNLWQAYASMVRSTSGQDLPRAFNEHTLSFALRTLGLRQSLLDKPAFQTLERQIAIYTILPARAMFKKRFESAWKSRTIEPALAEVLPVVDEIYKTFGAAATEFLQSTSQAHAAMLFSIACRLVPRSDMVGRRAEAVWLEGLFVCLSACSGIPPGETISTQQLSAVGQNSITVEASDYLLNELDAAVLEPSLPFWQFYAREAVLRDGLELSYTFLAKTVKLNASVFVLGSNKESLYFLEALATHIQEKLVLHETDHHVLITEVLCPIVEANGKARKMPELLTFWDAKLVDTFHDRISVAPTTTANSKQGVWDDPTLLAHLTYVCRRYAVPSLSTDLLVLVSQDLENLPNIMGPTHQVFARVTLFMRTLEASQSDPIVKAALSRTNTILQNATLRALGRTTDYQGRRWQLWRLLDLLMRFEQKVDHDVAQQFSDIPWPFAEWEKTPRTSSTLRDRAVRMEQFHCFCTLATTHELASQPGKLLLEKSMSALEGLVRNFVDGEQRPPTETILWNGSIDTMDSTDTLVSACITRVAAIPASQFLKLDSSHSLLVSLIRWTPGEYVEALLDGLSAASDLDIVDIFLEDRRKQDDVTGKASLPSLLHKLCLYRINKGQAQKLINALHKELVESHDMASASFVDHLGLLQLLCSDHAVSVGRDGSVKTYIDILAKTNIDVDPDHLIIAQNCIEQTVSTLIDRMLSRAEMDPSSEELSDLLDWVKKKIKKASATHKGRLLDTYDGFAVLAVLASLATDKLITASKTTQKAVKKVQERYQEMAVDIATQYLDHEASAVTMCKAWLLIRTLYIARGDRSLTELEVQRLLDVHNKLRDQIVCLESESTASTLSNSLLLSMLPISKLSASAKGSDLDADIRQAIEALNKSQGLCHNTVDAEARLATRGPQHLLLDQNALHKKEQLDVARGKDQKQQDYFNIKWCLSVVATVNSLTPEELSGAPIMAQHLVSIACLEEAAHEAGGVGLIARLELSKTILEKQPLMVNQHVIDTILHLITFLASSTCKLSLSNEVNNPRPRHIFDRICTILSTLLIRYRRRLTGRHHLLLPALQALLKCLFYPPTRNQLGSSSTIYPSRAAFLESLPHWLNPRNRTSGITLPASSASKFSRILQTLCDPSISAARRTQKRRHPDASNNNPTLNLNDETKQLRRQVSEHTQYLLQTYCQATLDGSIAPEVKQKLLPGIYAVMNAMDVEVMRGLNAAMDGNGRSIWRDLYASWKSEGRWNQR